MNKDQRKDIAAIATRLENFYESDEMTALNAASTAFEEAKEAFKDAREAAASVLEDIKQDIESQASDEQDKFDNMPESLQGSDNGQTMEAGVESLNEAAEYVDSAIETLRGDDYDEDEASEVEQSISDAVEQLGELT